MYSSIFLLIFLTPWILAQSSLDYNDISDRTVVIRLEPQPKMPNFLKSMEPPKTIETPRTIVSDSPPRTSNQAPAPSQIQRAPQLPPVQQQRPVQNQNVLAPLQPNNLVNGQGQGFTPVRNPILNVAPPGVPTPSVSAQQPILNIGSPNEQRIIPHDSQQITVPPPPPVNIPPDVQNQLIKFFGLDSFGIPGLTGNHPNGFAGTIQELRAAGIPVQGLPLEHINGGQHIQAPQNDVLAGANPNFRNGLNDLLNEANSGGPFHGSGNVPLPDPKPGENGLIGLLSSSIRKLVKDTGVSEALSQGIPSLLGTGGSSGASSGSVPSLLGNSAANTDGQSISEDKPAVARELDASLSHRDIRRQQSASQKAVNGLIAALGGGGNAPAHSGLPRVPGIPLLPGGIPRNSQGQIDVVNLIGSITRRISNGTTLADVLPPEQLQTLADNVTDALLPQTPEDFDLAKFMGRWFEGINSPRATEQRCVVHHYGGLTHNEKTATFTALKIYREGSEFGQVRYAIGYAFRGGNKDAMLQLHTSENADAQPFWIYKLGPEGTDPFGNKQYEYAIVSNWVKYPVTVLVRDPDTFKSKYEPEVLRWLEDQGFINGFVRAFNLIQPSTYSACQYADSTFELFGKK